LHGEAIPSPLARDRFAAAPRAKERNRGADHGFATGPAWA